MLSAYYYYYCYYYYYYYYCYFYSINYISKCVQSMTTIRKAKISVVPKCKGRLPGGGSTEPSLEGLSAC